MFDPEELNSKINQSFKNQEKVEAEAQGLENKLLENYEFKTVGNLNTSNLIHDYGLYIGNHTELTNIQITNLCKKLNEV